MRLAAVRRETGAWHKAMPPPHAKIPGDTATCPGGALPPPPSLPLTAWRSGRGHARPFPKWGTSCQLILSPSSNEGLQWFSRPPGIWHRVCASESKSVCTPVAPPLEPSLCSQLPTPLWWRSRSPALPHRPPPPTTAVACIVRVVLCVCQRLPRVWHGCVRCVRCEWV